MRLPRLCTCLAALFFSGPLSAHEFWIEPQKFQVEPGDTIVADLRNGQNFQGIAYAWFDTRTVRSETRLGDQTHQTTGRAGDVPAITAPASEQGLAVVLHESVMQTLTYADWEKFDHFTADKGLGDARAITAARGLDGPPFDEGFRRFAKALIAVGHGQGTDAHAGLETEIVALANPYTDNLSDGLPIRLLYQDAPRASTQIDIFARTPDGTVTRSVTHTDADGGAHIPVTPGNAYLLNAVILRPPAPETAAQYGIVWESLWASLTFAVP